MAEKVPGLVETDRRIILVGKTGNGKSATGNTILGENLFPSKTCPSSTTKTCQKEESTWKDGRKIVVVDTPGFFDTKVSKEKIDARVRECMTLCSPGPHVILQVMKTGCFTQEQKDVAQLISETFSLKARNYMILLFTRKEDLDETSLKTFIHEEPALWYQASQCGNRYLAFNNRAKGAERESQLDELMKMIDKLVEDNKGAPCYTEEMLKKDEEEFKEKKKEEKKGFWSWLLSFLRLESSST